MSSKSRVRRAAAGALTVVTAAGLAGGLAVSAAAQEPGVTTRIDALPAGREMTGDARSFFYVWPADTTDPAREAGLYVYDRTADTHAAVSTLTTGEGVHLGGVSDNGRYVHYDRPTPNARAARASFVLDRVTGTEERTSWSGRGRRILGVAGDVSNNGRIVLFSRDGDHYARNVARDRTRLVTVAPDGKKRERANHEVSLSGNGRFVAWSGKAGKRAGTPYTQVWVHDRVAHVTRLVSTAKGGGYGNGGSRNVSISNDGRLVAYSSNATNLVRKHDGAPGVFVRDLDARKTRLVSQPATGHSSTACSGSFRRIAWDCLAVSGDGRFVSFWTQAALLPEDDDRPQDQPGDLYVRDLATGELNLVNVPTTGTTANTDGVRGSDQLSVRISTDGRFIAFDSLDDTLDPTSVPATRTHDNYYVRDRGPQS